MLFDMGEGDSDEGIDGMDFEVPSVVEASEKTAKDAADSSVRPSPSGKDFVMAARTTDNAPFELADAPNRPLAESGLFIVVYLCAELMLCLTILYSCTSVPFYLKFLMYQFITICGLVLA
jgi:hypothetical protein